MINREIAAAEILTSRIKTKARKLESSENVVLLKKQYTRESVVEAYKNTGTLQLACLETGCPPYIAYKWLKFSKALKNTDSAKFGSAGHKAAAQAELLFKKLVPFAMSTNKHLETNCPSYDYLIGDCSVDVKFSRLGKDKKYKFWTGHEKHMTPDYFVVFCAQPGRLDLDGDYKVYVIPYDIVSDVKGVYINSSGSIYDDFEIAAEELADFFYDYAVDEN